MAVQTRADEPANCFISHSHGKTFGHGPSTGSVHGTLGCWRYRRPPGWRG